MLIEENDENEEKMILIDSDNDNTEYLFKMEIENSNLHFWLKENKVYAPFTFEQNFTMSEIIEKHKCFKSCDNLEEVYKHLKDLYKRNRVNLFTLGPPNQRAIIFKVDYISIQEVDTKDFSVKLRMTEDKDNDLLELYKIQKEQIEKLNKIKSIIDNELYKEYPLCKEINEILKECEFDIDYKKYKEKNNNLLINQ